MTGTGIEYLMASESELIAVHRRWHDTYRPDHNDPNAMRESRIAERAWIEAKRRISRAFATARGWHPAQTPFSLDQLRCNRAMKARAIDYDFSGRAEDQHHCFDHPEYFRDGGRPSRPVAIVLHAYASVEDCIAYGKRVGLNVEILPVCWSYPRNCTPFVLTRLPLHDRPRVHASVATDQEKRPTGL